MSASKGGDLMIEARIGQIIILKTPTQKFEGLIDNVEMDRITINYFKRDAQKFKTLQEADEVRVYVHTKFGIKKMKSMVIDNSGPKLVIENAPTITETDKRNDVRTTVNMKIFVKVDNSLVQGVTMDLSAGGVKFEIKEKQSVPKLDIGSEVDVKFINEAFKNEMSIKANIIKALSQKVFVAQFSDENEHLKSKISSFCMRNMD